MTLFSRLTASFTCGPRPKAQGPMSPSSCSASGHRVQAVLCMAAPTRYSGMGDSM